MLLISCHAINGQSKKIQVEFTNTVETVSILQDLWVNNTGKWPGKLFKNPVKEDIKVYFEKNKNHKAVAMTKEIANSKLSFSGPLLIALRITKFPKSKINYDLSETYDSLKNNELQGKAYLDEYVRQLNDFYNVAKVSDFLKKHKYYYDQALKETKKNMPNENAISIMEKYYGKSFASYHFILSLTNFPMGYASSLKYGKKTNIYQTTSALSNIDESKSEFGFSKPDKIKELTFHEYGHSFVSLTPHIETVNSLENLFDPIRENMKKRGYDLWKVSLDEHIVRAVEIRLWEHEFKDDIYANKLKSNYASFEYIPQILEQLKIYETNRDKYPNFDLFIPVILKSLKKI
jgi:hypothetical protein